MQAYKSLFKKRELPKIVLHPQSIIYVTIAGNSNSNKKSEFNLKLVLGKNVSQEIGPIITQGAWNASMIILIYGTEMSKTADVTVEVNTNGLDDVFYLDFTMPLMSDACMNDCLRDCLSNLDLLAFSSNCKSLVKQSPITCNLIGITEYATAPRVCLQYQSPMYSMYNSNDTLISSSKFTSLVIDKPFLIPVIPNLFIQSTATGSSTGEINFSILYRIGPDIIEFGPKGLLRRPIQIDETGNILGNQHSYYYCS